MRGKAFITSFISLLLACALIQHVFAFPQRKIRDEYELKAQLIGRICHYVSWPQKVWSEYVSTHFIVGVIGDGPIKGWLEKFYIDEKIKRSKVRLLFFTTPEELTDCHVLFISASAAKDLAQILAFTRKKPILTMGDTTGFAQQGVHINFFHKSGTIKFEINVGAMREASMSTKRQLLRLARIVNWREEDS